MQRKLENTQQRVRRISSKATVWASSASQSNIWKQFLSCNNKNTQHPRFQAQHSYIKPHYPRWSGLRKEAYTKIQLGLNISSQRVHSMTTQLTESPTLARRQVLWGHSQIPQITLGFHSDCPLAWKQFCGCRWKEEGVSQKKHVLKCSVSVWVNVMTISFACVIMSGLADRFWCWDAKRENRDDQAACLLFTGSFWKDWSNSESYNLSISLIVCMFKYSEQGKALRLWTERAPQQCPPFCWNSVHLRTSIRAQRLVFALKHKDTGFKRLFSNHKTLKKE